MRLPAQVLSNFDRQRLLRERKLAAALIRGLPKDIALRRSGDPEGVTRRIKEVYVFHGMLVCDAEGFKNGAPAPGYNVRKLLLAELETFQLRECTACGEVSDQVGHCEECSELIGIGREVSCAGCCHDCCPPPA